MSPNYDSWLENQNPYNRRTSSFEVVSEFLVSIRHTVDDAFNADSAWDTSKEYVEPSFAAAIRERLATMGDVISVEVENNGRSIEGGEE